MDTLSQEILLVSGVTSIFVITIFLIIIATGIIMLVLIYQKKQIRYLKEKEQLKVSFEKEILESKLEIQEQTLKNISQEIHDNIGQVLSLAKLNINTMNDATPEALYEKINDSKQLISKAIQDLRDLSKSLNTDYVNEMGLINSIEYELEMIKKTGSFEIQFNIEGKPFRLEQQQELIIFRIVQEALHNIIKHAVATVINVLLKFNNNSFTLTINDNGAGFDTSELEKNNYNGLGLGLRNMNNRAKLINTDFNLSSILQKGTTVTLSLQRSGINRSVMLPKTNVVLIDDHVLLRNGLANLIKNFGNYNVLFEANNGKDFIKKLQPGNLPGAILMDINMPEMDGYETCLWLKENHPEIRVLALSMYDNESAIIRIFKAGARGYILKDADPAELRTALDDVITKGFYYSEMVSGTLIRKITDEEDDDNIKNVNKLKEHEVTFLKLVCTELTYKEIADKMFKSPRTIDGYRDDLFEKLNVKTRVGLVMYAIKNGIVTL